MILDEVTHSDRYGGAEGIRTLDLLDAIEARSQLRHGPTAGCTFYSIRAQRGQTRRGNLWAQSAILVSIGNKGRRAGV